MRIRAAALAVLLTVCAASSASAAPWKRVTTPDGGSTDQVGLARTGDGVLHLAWSHPTGPNTEDLNHTVITPAGRIGATTPIQSGWTGFTNAALVVDPGGLRAFWGGFRTHGPERPAAGDEHRALGGRRRELGAPARLGRTRTARSRTRSNTAATVRPDGSTLQAFAGTLGTWVHAGLSPATPNHDYQAPLGPYGYDPNLATDASGRSVMAWYSSAVATSVCWRRSSAADGSPSASAVTMPGTSGMQVGMLGRTPLAPLGRGLVRRVPDSEPDPRLASRRRKRAGSSGACVAPAAPRWRSPRRPTGACGSCGRRASATRTCSRAARTSARGSSAPS